MNLFTRTKSFDMKKFIIIYFLNLLIAHFHLKAHLDYFYITFITAGDEALVTFWILIALARGLASFA